MWQSLWFVQPVLIMTMTLPHNVRFCMRQLTTVLQQYCPQANKHKVNLTIWVGLIFYDTICKTYLLREVYSHIL